MTNSIIKMRGVEKTFGSNTVLNGLDLEVLKGEVLVLIGGSGAGKSVTLKHIIGLLHPDRGTVEVFSKNLANLNDDELFELRNNVGYLFQGGALLNSLTVFENVALPLREHTDMNEEEIRERVLDRLDIVGLKSSVNTMPDVLSGGMRKRVSLARVIVQEPKIILYDEPTHGLDPIMANRINELITDLQERIQVTSVVVTHDIAGALQVANRIGMLHRGKIVKTGNPQSFLESEDPIVRQFVYGETDSISEPVQ